MKTYAELEGEIAFHQKHCEQMNEELIFAGEREKLLQEELSEAKKESEKSKDLLSQSILLARDIQILAHLTLDEAKRVEGILVEALELCEKIQIVEGSENYEIVKNQLMAIALVKRGEVNP